MTTMAVSVFAQVNCPPTIERNCVEISDPFPTLVLEQDVIALVPGDLIGDLDCEESDVQLEYFLHDLVNDEISSQPECYQDIVLKSFDAADIVWPAALIDEVGRPLDEVLADPMITEGLSPALDNACNIIYSYRDVILPGQVVQKAVRTWTALDWCTARTYEFMQVIKASLPTVNDFFVDIRNCSGYQGPELIDDFDIVLNGTVINYQNCSGLTIADLLNCIATANSLGDTDLLELKFKSSQSPLRGISTVDLVKIQRHILALEPFSSDCRLYAADVNNDNVINGIDLIELRKLILGIYTTLPQTEPVHYYLNGDITKPLSFRGTDFPLSEFYVSVVNKGVVD